MPAVGLSLMVYTRGPVIFNMFISDDATCMMGQSVQSGTEFGDFQSWNE